MIDVKMVTGSLKGQYNWGIKNYVINLSGSMPSDVKMKIIENGTGSALRYFTYPRSVARGMAPREILHLASQTFGYYTKFRIKNPTVVTCHDMMAFSSPQLFDSRKQPIVSRLAIRGMEKCDAIISVSEFTKRQIMRHMKVDEEKIRVIYSGIGKGFRPVKKRNDDDYIVYFGSEEKRKNVLTLIEAFRMLKKSYPSLKLVKNYKNPVIWKKVCSMGLEKDVIVTGNIDEHVMAEYYSSARAFVYPSLFEGFGFTPLEAMACGCPVVASNATSIPEILGTAPVYFEPGSAVDMHDKISMVLDDEALAKKLSRRSMARSKRFSWKKTSLETRKVYREVIR